MLSFTPDLLLALALFAFVSSITPGPNNTMLMASGANFGLRRTAPHLMGVVLGFPVLLVCIGLGLGGLFHAYPALHQVLKYVGGAYMLFLAWKLATAKGISGGKASGRPQTFWQAAAFQWVNPKAWAMGVGAITTYVPVDHPIANLMVVAFIFMVVNGPCVFAWATSGAALRRFLDKPRVLTAFNWTMAGLLVLSLYPLVTDLH
jgi:threonine/homoserine/homoserine lactone efflux protein